MRKFLLFILLIVTFATCTEDEITPRDYPRVRTKSIKVKPQEGAFFTGEIIFKREPIIDHGFVWGTNALPSLSSGEKVSLGARNDIGVFEGSVTSALIVNKKYYVRAYAKTENYTVYGEVLEFISLGSFAPQLISIKPTVGTWADTVIVVGKNLAANTKCFFNETEANVIYTNKVDTLKAIVPSGFTNKTGNVAVSFDNNVAEIENGFSLIEPKIVSITPSTGSPLIDVEITGEFFHPEINSVKFSGKVATITFSSAQLIKLKVPAGILGGTNVVLVQTGDNLAATTTFTNNPPVITAITPAEAWVTEEITITGNYFGPDVSSNQVLFDGTPGMITEASKELIKVAVPIDVQKTNPKIEVVYNQQSAVSNSFKVKEFVVESIAPSSSIFPYTQMSVVGKFFPLFTKLEFNHEPISSGFESVAQINFAPPYELNQHSNLLTIKWGDYEVNQELTSKWIRIDDSPSNLFIDQAITAYNNKAYFLIGTGDPENVYDVWVFDSQDYSWTNTNLDSILEHSSPLTSFTVGHEYYTFVSTNEGLKLQCINWLTNQITIKNPSPASWIQGAFVVNDQVYITESMPDHSSTTIWKYFPTTDSWQKIHTTNYWQYSFTVVSNNKIYYSDGYALNVSNLESASFAPESEFPFNINTDWPEFIFSIDEKIYFGLSNSQFWSYNTIQKVWTDEGFRMGMGISYSKAIVIQGKGYVISGFEGGVEFTSKCFEFDPSY